MNDVNKGHEKKEPSENDLTIRRIRAQYLQAVEKQKIKEWKENLEKEDQIRQTIKNIRNQHYNTQKSRESYEKTKVGHPFVANKIMEEALIIPSIPEYYAANNMNSKVSMESGYLNYIDHGTISDYERGPKSNYVCAEKLTSRNMREMVLGKSKPLYTIKSDGSFDTKRNELDEDEEQRSVPEKTYFKMANYNKEITAAMLIQRNFDNNSDYNVVKKYRKDESLKNDIDKNNIIVSEENLKAVSPTLMLPKEQRDKKIAERIKENTLKIKREEEIRLEKERIEKIQNSLEKETKAALEMEPVYVRTGIKRMVYGARIMKNQINKASSNSKSLFRRQLTTPSLLPEILKDPIDKQSLPERKHETSRNCICNECTKARNNILYQVNINKDNNFEVTHTKPVYTVLNKFMTSNQAEKESPAEATPYIMEMRKASVYKYFKEKADRSIANEINNNSDLTFHNATTAKFNITSRQLSDYKQKILFPTTSISDNKITNGLDVDENWSNNLRNILDAAENDLLTYTFNKIVEHQCDNNNATMFKSRLTSSRISNIKKNRPDFVPPDTRTRESLMLLRKIEGFSLHKNVEDSDEEQDGDIVSQVKGRESVLKNYLY